jgi:hypothetical protein
MSVVNGIESAAEYADQFPHRLVYSRLFT